jgi:hypothetical protein
MPHASRRIDLLVLPPDPDQPLDETAVSTLFRTWGVDDRGHVDHPERLMAGGFKRVWVDRPGRVWLYGNQVGGFRVLCPETRENISGAFGRAHRAWKAGSERTVDCPACGSVHALEGCEFVPPAAFARWALIFSDASSAVLTPEAEDQLTQALGKTRVILRRP